MSNANLRVQLTKLFSDKKLSEVVEFLRLNPGTKSIYGAVKNVPCKALSVVNGSPVEVREDLEEFKIIIACLNNCVGFDIDPCFWVEFFVSNFNNYFANKMNQYHDFILYILQQSISVPALKSEPYSHIIQITDQVFEFIDIKSLPKTSINKIFNDNLSYYCIVKPLILITLFDECVKPNAVKKFKDLKSESLDRWYKDIIKLNTGFYERYKQYFEVTTEDIVDVVVAHPEVIDSVPFDTFNIYNWEKILTSPKVMACDNYVTSYLNRCDVLSYFDSNSIKNYIKKVQINISQSDNIIDIIFNKYTTDHKFSAYAFDINYNLRTASVDEVAGYVAHHNINTLEKLMELNDVVISVNNLLSSLLINHTIFFMSIIELIYDVLENHQNKLVNRLFHWIRNDNFIAAVRAVLQRKELRLSDIDVEKLKQLSKKFI